MEIERCAEIKQAVVKDSVIQGRVNIKKMG